MYGIHINSDENFEDNIMKAYNYGCKIIQIFVSIFVNSEKLVDEFLKLTKKYNMSIICHSSYTINLAVNWYKSSWTIQELLTELKIAKKMNAPLVVHMGKQKDLTKEKAYNNMLSSLFYVLRKTKHTLLLETSSGQGTELFSNLDELGYFYKKIKNNPILSKYVGICLDTCHVFVSGYDLASKIKSEIFLDYFDKTIGIKNIKCVHLNDSAEECNSKMDRHKDFGKGFIGKEAMDYLFYYFMKLKIPIILKSSLVSLINLPKIFFFN